MNIILCIDISSPWCLRKRIFMPQRTPQNSTLWKTYHLELAKTLSEEDKSVVRSYIDAYKKKAAEDVIRSNPQLVPKQEVVDNSAILAEKDKMIEQLKDENKTKHEQYLQLYSKYSEARKKLVHRR